MLWLSTATLVVDYGQTRHIAKNPEYHETNRLLGREPSLKDVDIHFGGAILINGGVGCLLPKKHRNAWWGAVTFMQSATIANNYRIGIKMSF